MKVACVLVTHLRAKVEMRRQPRLKDQPVLIIDRLRGRSLVADHFPAATGAAAGMTLEEALSRHPDVIVLEADEAGYRREFHRMLTSLQGVSDRVEGGMLRQAQQGTAYVGLDGLEALYGDEARLVTTLLNAVPQELAPRAGVGEAKFPAYVAARASQPFGATRVPPDPAGFLAPQPVHLLPLPAALRAELRRFGLHTLGDVAEMKVNGLTDRFGPAGQRAWELARGIDHTALVPMKYEESVVEHAALPFQSASLELLLTATDTLLRQAYAQPRMQGRYAGGVELECVLYRAQPWRKDFRFKQAAGEWARASCILRGQLEHDHPQAPVEEVTLSLTNLTEDSGMQLSLLAELRGDRDRRLAQAERQIQARTGGRPALHRVVEVAPWHPAPEMRAMQVPLDASGPGTMRPLCLPTPAEVREGPEGEPAAVLMGERWHRVAVIENRWCFDLWWMPQPMTRTYYRVGREDGREVTLFRDQHQERWFRQAQ